MLREGFIIFLHGGVQRQQMATVGIRDDNQFAGALVLHPLALQTSTVS
jgi:hypothetical protein